MTKSVHKNHINLFLMLSQDQYLDRLKTYLEQLCKTYSCNYEIKRSAVVNRFYYIRIDVEEYADDIEKAVESMLKDSGDAVSWYKVEFIEIK